MTVFLPERNVKVFHFNDSLTSEPQSGPQKVALMSLMLIRVSLWFNGQILKTEQGTKTRQIFRMIVDPMFSGRSAASFSQASPRPTGDFTYWFLLSG